MKRFTGLTLKNERGAQTLILEFKGVELAAQFQEGLSPDQISTTLTMLAARIDANQELDK